MGRETIRFRLLFSMLATLVAVGPVRTSALAQQQADQKSAPWPPAGVHLLSEPGITRPQLIQQAPARFTPGSNPPKLTGSVIISVVVEHDGTVSDARIAQPLDPIYDAACLEAARHWRFSPPTFNDTPIRVLAPIEFRFNLGGPPPPAAAPVLSWPRSFPTAPDATPPTEGWIDDVERADGIEFRLSLPNDWAVRPSPTHVATIMSRSGRASLGLSHPKATTIVLDAALAPDQLESLVKILAGSQNARMFAATPLVGQVRTPAALWVWVEAPLSLDRALMPPDIAAAAAGSLNGATMWDFTTTMSGRLVQVTCAVVRDRDESDAEFERDEQYIGGVCGRIIQRLTVVAR